MDITANAIAVVQAQLDAYNARDIEAFMAFWTEDSQLLAHPNTVLATGLAEIRARHIARFQEPNLHGKLVNRLAVGAMVVDQEIVTRTFPEGPGHIEAICIYEVTNNHIAKAWYRMGPPILD